VGALLLGAVASQTFAATVTYTATSSNPAPLTSEWNKTNWTGTVIVPKFNATLGTLTKITLNLSSGMSSVFNITNTNTSVASVGRVYAEERISLTNSAAGISGLFTNYISDEYAFNVAASGSATSPNLTGSKSKSTDYTGTALTAFTGAGNITLDTVAATEVWLNYTGGNVGTTNVTYADLTGTVTYTYNVPEPACLGALAAGLCLTLRRRRR